MKFNKPLAVLLFTTVVDLMGFGILLPIIPILLANPQSQFYLLPHGLTLMDGYILLGLLTAVYPLMQFLTAPILGQLSDKYGRKKLLAFALSGTALSYIVFALGIIMHNIPVLFISRAIDGALGGSVAISQAAVADITIKKNRVKNFGLMGAAFSFGFIIGPFLGGVLSNPGLVSWFNAATPFWFAAILSFLNVISVIIFLPETLKNPANKLKINFIKSARDIVRAYTSKALRVLYLTNFLYNAGFTFFTSFAAVFLIHRLSFTQGSLGNYFAYLGVIGIISQVVVVRLVANRYKESSVLKISLLVTSIVLGSYFFIFHLWELLILSAFFSVFNGLSLANMTALISNSVSSKIQGEVLGIWASVRALAEVFPPILAGFIAATLTPETPLLVAAAILFITSLVFIIFYKKLRCKLNYC